MRKLLSVVFLVATLSIHSAVAQTLKAAYHRSGDSPGGQALVFFKNSVETCTDRVVTVELLLQGAYGQPPEVAKGVSEGALDLAIVPSRALQPFSKAVGALSVPFLFNNRRHWEAALSKEAFSILTEQIGSNANIRLLGFLGGEQYGMLSSSPILTSKDIAGRNIQTLGGFGQVLASLGANPANIAFAETYSALQTGAIDSWATTTNSALQSKAYEVTGDFTRTNHQIFTDLLIINSNTFNGLDDSYKQCVIAAAEEGSSVGREAVVMVDNAALDNMAQLGVNVHRISDRQFMFQSAAKSRDEFIAVLDAGTLLEVIAKSAGCPDWCDNNTCSDDKCDLCSVCE